MFALPNSLEINKDFFDLEKHQFDSRDSTVFYGHALDSKMRKYSKELLIYKYAENFFTATEDESSMFIREVCFHHMFRKHENFVRILGYCTDPLVYVHKYYKDYTLYDALHHGEITFTKRQRYDIIYEISSGISIMHKSGVSHNALCAQRIFFENQDDDYKAFISGFYMATVVSHRKPPPIYNFDFMDDDKKTIFYRYAAPEILQGIKRNDLRYQTERISKSVDIYSLGCLICEIITGKVLWRKRKAKRTSHDDKDKGFSANNSTTQSSLSPIHDND
jgi:serine/threonine protein kinase